MKGDTLITKYRPETFEDVVGQAPVVKSLQGVLARKSSRGFLFEGEPGTGKTTLARVIAIKLGCDPRNIIEVDAATNTGIDAMRAVTDSMRYTGLGKSKTRFYILDEAHMLSKQAWASLLKATEEPPKHVYWALCTTDGAKLPKAIRTRFTSYTLSPVPTDTLFDLITKVARAEKYTTPKEVRYFIAEKAGGSPRQALACLAQCADCETRKDAAVLIRAVLAEGEIIELCQGLMQGLSWSRAMGLVQKLGDVNAESVRQIVLNYFGKVAGRAKTDEKAGKALDVLDAFNEPYPPGNNAHCVLLSLGRILLP